MIQVRVYCCLYILRYKVADLALDELAQMQFMSDEEEVFSICICGKVLVVIEASTVAFAYR